MYNNNINSSLNPSLFQNYTWNNNNNLEISMEEHTHLHDDQQIINPFASRWPPFPLICQTQETRIGLSSPTTTTLFADHPSHQTEEQEDDQEPEEELGAMKEMMYKIAAMQPVDIDPATVRKPKRRNVRISDDPQSVAARHRRERISEKIRILQRLVPGGTKMDTASMLDEAIRYVKFLKRQIRVLQANQPPLQQQPPPPCVALPYNKNPNTLGSPPGFGCDGEEPLCFNHEVISD